MTIPTPDHLARHEWYQPHQAWLASRGYVTRHDAGGALPMRANLRDANLTDANLTRADLRDADLRDAYLTRANLRDANLTRADLRGAVGVRAPKIENIDAAILNAINASGCSLQMDQWHTCQTTHCRAGWAIHLCGDAGYALEDRIGAAAAGALIYAASRPGVPVPDFYASTDDAIADIKRCAALAPATEVCDE